jgi:hypothetical protein
MSKVDAQRAMREARYAALTAQASTRRRATPDASAARVVRAAAPSAAPSASASASAEVVEVIEVATPAAEKAPGKAPGTKARAGKERVTEASAATARTGAKASRSSGGVSGPVADSPIETQGLCGHRNIGNKSCQRPAGHAEKNHRYK